MATSFWGSLQSSLGLPFKCPWHLSFSLSRNVLDCYNSGVWLGLWSLVSLQVSGVERREGKADGNRDI